jgi:hypothetical protein
MIAVVVLGPVLVPLVATAVDGSLLLQSLLLMIMS